jgi:dihydropteroate synthase
VPLEEELRRVLPVVRALAGQTDVPLSVDTYKAAVARACLEAGAAVVNDITALAGDPDMPEVVRQSGCGAILMHMQGTPQTMQQAPHYDDVVVDIGRFFEERLQDCAARGIAAERLALDPGIGFGKTAAHNLKILARLPEFQRFGRPVCLGVSRKGFLGRLLGDRPAAGRLASSLAAACYALGRGAVQIIRVHDVVETRDAVTVFQAVRQHG